MKRIFPLFLLMVILRLSSAQVSIQDSIALVALYYATDGENWTNNTNWLTGPVEDWHGVTLSEGRVYVLNLYDNGLNGSIPTAIGQLTGMVELDLRKASFSGGIPEEIGQLTKLYQLNLSECGLTGEIPATLGNCTKLGRLYLSKNQLTGSLPTSLAQCPEMIFLHVDQNELAGPFPEIIRSMPALRRLDLGKNRFSGSVPSWINSLGELNSIALGENLFEGPLPRIDSLNLLTGIDLTYNLFTGDLDTILGYYPDLAYCFLHDNLFSGHLSPDHFNPEKIVRLWLFNNHVNSIGLFTDWINYPNFNQLYVTYNDLDFDDLLPNSSMPTNKFLCQTQHPIGHDTIIAMLPGESYTISSPMQDPGVQYQWFFNHQLITGATGPEFSIEPFTPEQAGTYFYTATHTAFPTMTLLSATTTIEEETTSIAATDKSYLRMYPNPTPDDIFLVSSPHRTPFQVQLYSADGHLLLTREVQDQESSLSLKDYPSGMYFLKTVSLYGNSLNRINKW